MKLWGVITEVNEKDIVVGLPGGLRGLVRSCEALDSFSDNKERGVCCTDIDVCFVILTIFLILFNI